MRKSFTIADFMAGKHNETFMDRVRQRITQERIEKWIKTATSLTVPVSMGLVGHSAFAAVPTSSAAGIGATSTALVLKAFDPLINLIQNLAYPIAGIMIAGGCLMVMVGMKDKGVDMLRNAAIGYILVQLSPLLLKILVGVSGGVV